MNCDIEIQNLISSREKNPIKARLSGKKMAGYCSLVILCLGAVAALSAMALVAIAATTDHWVETRVDREAVEKAGKVDEHEIVFFSRHRGIFSVCFPATDPGELKPTK